MPTFKHINIKDLLLDLNNPRTVSQKVEIESIKAMISISPDRFFAVMNSILSEGYLPTENLLVVHDPKNKKKYIVREGNRRTAILKIICGLYKVDNFEVPSDVVSKINSLNKIWVKANGVVPCAIYENKEIGILNRTISLTHAKGEKAGRENWNSIAKSRYNRDIKGAKENSLDLLEKYLSKGKNLTLEQKERWSGDYPITVLDEALPMLAARVRYAKIEDLVNKYPKIKYHLQLNNLLRDIGMEIVGFKYIRDKSNDFLQKYGFPSLVTIAPKSDKTSSSDFGTDKHAENGSSTKTASPSGTDNTVIVHERGKNESGTAHPLGTPQQVRALLKSMVINGNELSKVAELRSEILQLKIDKTPIAFCFVLRSMFDISAEVFCVKNKIKTFTENNGHRKDFELKQKLNKIVEFLVNKGVDKKILHGALTELGKNNGLLSIASLNQIVHNPDFSVAPSDICMVFSNVFPLLREMNF